MVRALAVRQIIRVADYALLALLGFVAYKAIVLMMGLDSPAQNTATTEQTTDVQFEVATVLPRDAYERIVVSKMFGPAGDLGKLNEDQGPTELVDSDKETELPLRLKGAMAIPGIPADPMASAHIANAAAQTIHKDATYFVDDEIMAGVRLLEVYPRRVKISNENNIEWLSVQKEQAPRSNAIGGRMARNLQAPRALDANANVQDAKVVTLPKDDTYQEMMNMDLQETINTLRPQVKYDENDNVVGLTSDHFSQLPLAQKTGFVDGDVITEVNGTPINSQESVYDILLKEQNATSVRIRFERDGRPMVRTVRLE